MRGVSRKTYNLTCNMCSLEFEAGRKDKKYCSKRCCKKYSEKNGSKLVLLICLTCSIEFKRENWYVNKMRRKGQNIFCSRGCASSYTNFHRNEKRILKCEGCKEEFLLNQSDAKDKYCSKKCYANHQRERLAKQCRRIGSEYADIISQKAIIRHKEKGHPWIGRHHSEETKKKFSESKKEHYETHDGPMKDKKHLEESKQKMSETKTKNWIEGKYDDSPNFCWVQGHFLSLKNNKKIFYRSSWEKAYFKFLEESENVVKYEAEAIRIAYYDTQNKKRHYIPDVLVEFKNGHKVLIEIKPSCFLRHEINKRKFKVAREYCKEKNIKFKVITEKYLKHIKAI